MLKNKTAVITGVTRGIGLAVLKKFSENYADSFVLVRKAAEPFLAEVQALKEEYGIRIEIVTCDLSDEESIKSAVRRISKEAPSVDILVNNAGMAADSTSFQMTSMNKMREVFQVNFFGMTVLTQYISRLMMRKKSGSIVNIASVAALDGTPAQYEYVCSKAAVVGAVKELAIELGAYGIRVNGVAPGITDTDMGGKIQSDLKDATLQNSVMKRMAEPGEIANAVLFLASDMASYMTGQVLRVDGGIL